MKLTHPTHSRRAGGVVLRGVQCSGIRSGSNDARRRFSVVVQFTTAAARTHREKSLLLRPIRTLRQTRNLRRKI